MFCLRNCNLHFNCLSEINLALLRRSICSHGNNKQVNDTYFTICIVFPQFFFSYAKEQCKEGDTLYIVPIFFILHCHKGSDIKSLGTIKVINTIVNDQLMITIECRSLRVCFQWTRIIEGKGKCNKRPVRDVMTRLVHSGNAP